MAALGRNDPCPCGSGKKYKHCCLAATAPPGSAAATEAQLRQALQLAFAHHQRGQAKQAEALCHNILRVLPRQPDAWHLLGVITLQQGDAATATSYFRRALSARPGNPETLSNLGFSYHEQGDLAQAQREYQRALAVAPGYVNALYNQHALYVSQQDWERAANNLRAVLQQQPGDHDARYMLGVLLDYRGEAAAAQSHLEALAQGTAMDHARLDAWQYLKSACTPLPPMTGSMLDTFRLALAASPHTGLVLEFGVRHGNSIRQIARLTHAEIHGFDSFEGLPEAWHHEPRGSYTTEGQIPVVPDHVRLHVGWFEDTLPVFLEQHAGAVRFINVDCDIYSATQTILNLLAPRIVPGSILVFDEYLGNAHWREDEFKAFQEAVAHYGWTYDYIGFSIFTKQVVVRIRSV